MPRVRSLALLLLLTAALAGCTSGERGTGSLVGDRAPGFAVQVVDGPSWSLEAQRGKAVLLDLMGVNCPPCREEMPHLLGVAARHADDTRFAMLSVDLGSLYPSLGAASDDDVRGFKADFNATWPFARDRDGTIGRAYDAIALPSFVVVGPDGVITWRQVSRASEAELEAAIAGAKGRG